MLNAIFKKNNKNISLIKKKKCTNSKFFQNAFYYGLIFLFLIFSGATAVFPQNSVSARRVMVYSNFLFGVDSHVRYDSFQVDQSGDYCTTPLMQKIYKNALLSKELINEIGFNSIQPFCPADAGMIALNASPEGMASYSKSYSTTAEFIEFLNGLKDTPVILAFSDIAKSRLPYSILKKENIWKNDTMVEEAQHIHVSFCPIRIDSEQGWKYLSAIYSSAAAAAVKNNINVLAYQVLNEIDYSDLGNNTRTAFKNFLEKKYGSVQAAARHYSMDDFDPLTIKLPADYHTPIRTLWGEFSESFFAKQVGKIVSLIKSADKRPHIRCSVEYNSGALYKQNSANNLWRLVREGGISLINGEYLMPSFGSYSSKITSDDFAGLFQGPVEPLLATEIIKAAGLGKLPLIDTEQAVKRYYNAVQVPIRPEDIPTRLWQNIFRGVSGVYFYAWAKFSTQWKKPWTLETARRCVWEYEFTGGTLINPYVFPGSALDAFQTFRGELGRTEKYLPADMGYGIARVFLIYSSSSRRQEGDEYLFKERLLSAARALEMKQIPWTIIWEESLEENEIPPEAQILMASAVSHLSDRAFSNLTSWVGRGGTLIGTAGSFRYNSLSAERKLKSINKIHTNITLNNLHLPGETIMPDKITILNFPEKSENSEILAAVEKNILIQKNKIGSGIYLLLPEFSSESIWPLESFLGWAVKHTALRTVWEAEDINHKKINDLELKAMGDSERLFIYLNLWGAETKLVNVKLDLPPGKYYISEIRKEECLVSEQNIDSWPETELAKGIKIALPCQEAHSLVVEKNKKSMPYKTVIRPEVQKARLTEYTRIQNQYIAAEKKHADSVNEMYEVKGKVIETSEIIKNGQAVMPVELNKLEWGEVNADKALLLPLPTGSKAFYGGSLKLAASLSLKKEYADKGYILMEINSQAPEGIIPDLDFHIKITSTAGPCRWDFTSFLLDGDSKTWQTAAVKLSEFKSVSSQKFTSGELPAALSSINEITLQFREKISYGLSFRNIRFVLTE